MVPLKNNLIISGRSRQLFRHLELQNLSTGEDFILSSGIIFLVPLFTTMGVAALLKIILSYREGRYSRLDTLNTKIRPLFQILDIEVILAP